MRSIALRAVVLTLACVVLSTCKKDVTGPSGEQGPEDPLAERRSRTFTTREDFAAGASNNVNTNATGELSVNPGVQLYETPFMWIPNSDARTVTKIDTRTRQVVGTYPLMLPDGEDCYSPSRTTVDMKGDVWVGCRGSVSGFPNSYTNRQNVTPAMVPTKVDHKVVKLSKEDGHVIFSIVVGHAPRALALDAQDRLWIGCSVDDTVWVLDNATGACLRGEGPNCAAPAIAVADFPYGSAVDQRGHLWTVHRRELTSGLDDVVSEIDTADGSVLGVYGPFYRGNRCGKLYGIAIDQQNNVWLGGFTCNDVVKLKGTTGKNVADGLTYQAGELIGSYASGGMSSRGVAVDLDGNVWVADSASNTASKLNNVSGTIIKTLNVVAHPIGVGVDAYGNAWVVGKNSDSVLHINGLNTTETQEIPVDQGPYSYSDMLGMALRTITHRADGFATWGAVIDSELDQPIWEDVTWSATEPNHTSMRLRTRCAATRELLAGAAWSEFMSEPGPLDCPGAGGRFAEVEAHFVSEGTTASPILHDLKVAWH